jgi:hypothetical protein
MGEVGDIDPPRARLRRVIAEGNAPVSIAEIVRLKEYVYARDSKRCLDLRIDARRRKAPRESDTTILVTRGNTIDDGALRADREIH